MLAASYFIFALFIIASVRSGARLEDSVMSDIDQRRFEPTPGTLQVVSRLKAAGIVRDADGQLVVDPAARGRRSAELKARVTRTTVIALGLAALLALGTKLLLAPQGK